MKGFQRALALWQGCGGGAPALLSLCLRREAQTDAGETYYSCRMTLYNPN